MKMKTTVSGLLALFAVSGICQTAQADALLIDVGGAGTPDSTSPWVSAGVTEDLTGAVGAQISGSGGVTQINNLTTDLTGNSGWNGGQTSGTLFTSTMLDDYMIGDNTIDANGYVHVTLGGFDNTMTSTMTGLSGDFTLQANSQYKVYLFGSGDNTGQNTKFTLGGVEKVTTANTLVENEHYVTYDISTPSSLSGYTIDFTFQNDNDGRFSGWNGAAIVAIPEPATMGLISIFGAGLLFARRIMM